MAELKESWQCWHSCIVKHLGKTLIEGFFFCIWEGNGCFLHVAKCQKLHDIEIILVVGGADPPCVTFQHYSTHSFQCTWSNSLQCWEGGGVCFVC